MKRITFVLIMMFICFALYAQATDAQIIEAANYLGVPYLALKQFMDSYRTQNINLDGRWVAEGYSHMGVEFSGNKFKLNTNPTAEVNMFGHIHQAQDGTYSISGSQIEFKFSDGRIVVESFTRTENTMTLRGRRLIKK